MIIEIYTKNYALTETIKDAQGPVPRIGETIEFQQDVGYVQDAKDGIVYDVVYILRNNELTPVVKCHPHSTVENRVFQLEQGGWR